jgi:hypothetical protein
MFNDIPHLQADHSTFNRSRGDQYNAGHTVNVYRASTASGQWPRILFSGLWTKIPFADQIRPRSPNMVCIWSLHIFKSRLAHSTRLSKFRMPLQFLRKQRTRVTLRYMCAICCPKSAVSLSGFPSPTRISPRSIEGKASTLVMWALSPPTVFSTSCLTFVFLPMTPLTIILFRLISLLWTFHVAGMS